MTLHITTHKNILIKILKDIFNHPDLGPVLGFKGGTAAYLFYRLNRFSVDLDFDLLEPGREIVVFEGVRNILEKYGTLKRAENKRLNLFYILSYDEKIPGAQNIKVEISKRSFGSQYEVKAYLGISMKVMRQEDMVAHKLVALIERGGRANRDIYDVCYFLDQGWPIHKELVEARTGGPYKELLKKAIVLLEKRGDKHLLAGMGELLDTDQKKWVKTKLRAEVIFQLKLRLEEEP